MFQIRIFVKLGGKVGELDLKKRDLADLCEIQPGAAGEWVSGGIERIFQDSKNVFRGHDHLIVAVHGVPP